jgi:hypothetical protein
LGQQIHAADDLVKSEIPHLIDFFAQDLGDAPRLQIQD